MKKNIKFALASVAVAIAGFGIYQNMPQEKTLSDFALENIEVLTQNENFIFFRFYPCPKGPGSECRTSNETQRVPCYKITYC